MTQDKKEQWLKKFDEEYGSFELCEVVNQKDHDKLKSFLSSLIDDIDRDWENRILEVVGEELRCECKDFPNPKCVQCVQYVGSNELRSQILEKLELKK